MFLTAGKRIFPKRAQQATFRGSKSILLFLFISQICIPIIAMDPQAGTSSSATAQSSSLDRAFSKMPLFNFYGDAAKGAPEHMRQAVKSQEYELQVIPQDGFKVYEAFYCLNDTKDVADFTKRLQDQGLLTSDNLLNALDCVDKTKSRYELAHFYFEQKILKEGIHCFFSRDDAILYALIGLILNEKEKIQIAVYHLTVQTIAQALVDAAIKNKVSV